MSSRWGWEDVKPSWTWPGFEGDSLQVVVYTSCDSVQLYLNGKYQGSKVISRISEFKAYWNISYEPGTLEAIGFIDGNEESVSALKTVGNPHRIQLIADRDQIKADNQDLSFITVEIVDENNNLIPMADNLIEFTVEGEGKLAAVGNGNPTSLESYQQPYRKTYEGRCLVIIQSTTTAGEIKLRASGDGLISDRLSIKTK